MTVHTWISMDFAYRLGWTLMHSLWEGVAIAAVLALVLTMLTPQSARARHQVLITALLVMVLAFSATFIVGPQERPSPRRTIDSNAIALVTTIPQTNVVSVARPSVVPPFNSWMIALSPTAAAFWLVGVSLLAAYRLAGWFAVQRLRTIQISPADSAVVQTAQQLADRLHLTSSFKILISNFAQTPMVIGWLSPIILLPASALTGLSPSQLQGILAHELAHMRRQDYLVNLLQIAAETLMFYHPAVWWISRQIRLEREQACDDIAISLCNDRYEYARSLAAVEELRFLGTPALAAAGSGGWQMLARIRRIVAPTHDVRRFGFPGLFAILLLVGGVVLIYCQATLHADPATKPFVLHNDADRLAPFTAVRWSGDVPEVQYNNDWYTLVDINDVKPAQIVDYLKQSNDFAPQKHFAEDLVQVMRDMGHPTSSSVKLVLKTLDSQKDMTVPDAPMTRENRKAVLEFNNSQGVDDETYRFDIPFEQGAVQFADGDKITVTKVKGTSDDMESGTCTITGTYTLASEDRATLAASITAKDPMEGTGPWTPAQSVTIKKGTGQFKLVLPLKVKGWPHVSFYNDVSDFGGSYIGTGDWVLRQWWDSSK